MDSNSVNRILVGPTLLLTTISSYLFGFELFLITILVILISYDFYNLKIYKLPYLIFLTLLPFASVFFFFNKNNKFSYNLTMLNNFFNFI